MLIEPGVPVPIELVPLATITLEMSPPTVLANAPNGTRVIVEFQQVSWQGERIRAQRKGATAGDWLVVGTDGTASLDARFVLETDDGALIYVHGSGRTDGAGFARGEPVYFDFLFETGDVRYLWLNRILAVAKGAARGSTVTLEVAEVR
jgi:hypothetical protein